MGTTRCLRWWLLFIVITETKTRPRDPQKQEGQGETNIRRPGSRRRNSKSRLNTPSSPSPPHPQCPSPISLSEWAQPPHQAARTWGSWVPFSSILRPEQATRIGLTGKSMETTHPNPVPLAHEWKQLLKASRREMGTKGLRVWVGTARE